MGLNTLKGAFVDFYNGWHQLVVALVILAITLVVTLVIHFILRKRYKQPSTNKHVWRDAIVASLNAPLQGIVWMIGLSLAVGEVTAGGQMQALAKDFPPARDVLVIIIVAWFLARIVVRAQTNLSARARAEGKDFDITAADAIAKLARAIIFIIAAMIIMQSLGFSIASLLAFGGVAGIAIGFAAQGLVANLFGGITVYVSRPFKVGEYVILPSANLMGEVQNISWRATRILGFNGKPFYVPNAKFNTEIIINHSRMEYRDIVEYIYLPLPDRDKAAAIVAEANDMLKEYPGIHHDFFVFNFATYDQHALKLFLYAYTVSTAYTEYMRVKEDLLLRIADIIEGNGAKLAVPVSNVYMPEGLALERELGRAEPVAEGLTGDGNAKV